MQSPPLQRDSRDTHLMLSSFETACKRVLAINLASALCALMYKEHIDSFCVNCLSGSKTLLEYIQGGKPKSIKVVRFP